MNLDEARKVLWLRSNPKPLGELLEEGFLTRERLQWAARYAFNPALQQAAKVLLDSQRVVPPQPAQEPVSIGITVEQARATLWPFPPYKGQPMGPLVNSKQLALKDLGFAAESAWDPKVRQAVMALLLVRLKQAVSEPVPSRGFIHLVQSGRSHAERRQLSLMMWEGVIFGLTVATLLFAIAFVAINTTRPHPDAAPAATVFSSSANVLTALVALALGGLLVWCITSIPDWLTKRMDQQIEDYRHGQEGEDRVVELMLQVLDGDWTLFRNINLPGRNRGDLDLVLVGPPGVWVLEVKNFRGQYRNVGDEWEHCQGKIWKRASGNPSHQARRNALRLKDFFAADNVKVFVNNAVVWANPESPLFIENPAVAVWAFDRLSDELGNLWQAEKLSQADRNKIIAKLTKLCEAQRKSS